MAVAKFVPRETEKKNKKGKNITPFQAITLEDIILFLNEKGSKEDKKIFKENYMGPKDADGNYGRPQFLYAKREFCLRHCPEIVPKTSNKKNLYDLMKDW